MAQPETAPFFALFNEIGIISQLSRAALEARLPLGLNQAQFSVLNHLVRVKDGRLPHELARAFQVPKTSMTHTLSVLERHGLIDMKPNPDDGRSKCVWITQSGTRYREDAIALMRANFAGLAERWPVENIGAILPHLTRLREILDQMRD